MKKSRGIIKIILIIIVLGVLGGFSYYYLFLHTKDTTNKELFPSLSKEKISDNKNGIYVFKTKADKSRTLLKNCVVDAINDYLVVINGNYYMYHGNCLNLVFVKQGLTETLKFEKDNNSRYSVELDDIKYNKDNSVNQLVVENKVVQGNRTSLNYDNLKAIIDYSEYPGYYYSFNGYILGNKYLFNYVYDENFNNFRFSLSIETYQFYSKNMRSFNDIPIFYSLADNMVIIDNNNKIDGNYRGELYVFSKNGKTYDYNSMFPIKVNDNVIDSSWNRAFRYDSINKVAYVVFSRSSDYCDYNNGNSYYEFKLNYDYVKGGFKTPDLYKKGTNSKDCTYVKKNYLME